MEFYPLLRPYTDLQVTSKLFSPSGSNIIHWNRKGELFLECGYAGGGGRVSPPSGWYAKLICHLQ